VKFLIVLGIVYCAICRIFFEFGILFVAWIFFPRWLAIAMITAWIVWQGISIPIKKVIGKDKLQ
jgi:hypothetical protein